MLFQIIQLLLNAFGYLSNNHSALVTFLSLFCNSITLLLLGQNKILFICIFLASYTNISLYVLIQESLSQINNPLFITSKLIFPYTYSYKRVQNREPIPFTSQIRQTEKCTHTGLHQFFKNVLNLFVCIKLNFFLQFSFLFLIYSPGGYNRSKTRPRRPQIIFFKENGCMPSEPTSKPILVEYLPPFHDWFRSLNILHRSHRPKYRPSSVTIIRLRYK